MGTETDEFVASQINQVTKENFEDVTSVWAGQNRVKKDLDFDAMDEIRQYAIEGV